VVASGGHATAQLLMAVFAGLVVVTTGLAYFQKPYWRWKVPANQGNLNPP
jgi:hypothetical protein